MDPVTTTVTIDRPREDVFEYLADIANHAEFMEPLFRDWRLTREDSYGRGAGARFRSQARMDRFGWGDLNFLEVEPPRRIVGVGRGGKYNRIKTYCEWTLEPAGTGDSTRVSFVFETEPPLPTDRIVEAISGRRGWFRRGARRSLKRLRARLEEGRTRGARATVSGLYPSPRS
ncbi:MAG: hypothetical protein QOG77_1393 [Solirubrobacteraceae bacterium]|nr:hypothetical protein [Solirubrobacteraceae bacterium]